MEKLILSAYASLCITALVASALAISTSIISERIKKDRMTWFFSIGMAMFWAGTAYVFGWRYVWMSGYLARNAVAWMQTHWSLLGALVIINIGGFFYIRSLTEDIDDRGYFWKASWVTAAGIFLLTYLS